MDVLFLEILFIILEARICNIPLVTCGTVQFQEIITDQVLN
jgi:hypothetical protein